MRCCVWAYMCPYTVMPVLSEVDFRKIGVGRSLSGVVMSWLRLHNHLDSIQHPYHMYAKCFSTLICCGWAYGSALTLFCLCRLEEEFRKIGVGLSLSDVVMSWLRLQTCFECIPHPYHMYTKCFITLICHGWAYVFALTLLCIWLSPSDVVMSWLRLQTPMKCIPHPYHMYTQCFNTLIFHGGAHESTPTLLGLCNRWG